MWCNICNRETNELTCGICGTTTQSDIPIEVYWCKKCSIPIITEATAITKHNCPTCNSKTKYLSMDIRPVFPEERLLMEIMIGKPLAFIDKSVWACDSRYYIDGKSHPISVKMYNEADTGQIIGMLEKYRGQNDGKAFYQYIERFLKANRLRLATIKEEAYRFIQEEASKYPAENIVISFSGGKDSTVTADLAVRALSNPRLVHIFGDTTLEFPLTVEYADQFRKENPLAIFKVAKNRNKDFYEVCKDIGPPARMLRWCCSMFKTGPITRVLNNLYRNDNILTFYGIRKCESVSRSKYKRVEDDAESIKIQQQTVASPIFLWKDIDIWLYILGEGILFNDAYRLGYDRVGCWCCPNNNQRAQFLSKIYMPEQYREWRRFLIEFAESIGKPDPEHYVDSGNWKKRQGGNGVPSARDIKIDYENCTTDEDAKTYRINKPFSDQLIQMFIPFGIISKDLGRRLIQETIVLDRATMIPIISIQPLHQDGSEYGVKIKTMNLKQPEEYHRMIGYQIRKHNACRKCRKCASLCNKGAITMENGVYTINEEKCTGCKMCMKSKFLEAGCLMDKYLKTKLEADIGSVRGML